MESVADSGAPRRARARPPDRGAALPGLPTNLREPEGGSPRLWGRLSLPLPRAEAAAPRPFFPERKPFWVTLAEARNGDLLVRLEGRR